MGNIQDNAYRRYFSLIDEIASVQDDSPNSNQHPPIVDDVDEHVDLMNPEDEENVRYDFCRVPKQKYSLGIWDIPMSKLRKKVPDERQIITCRPKLGQVI